MHRIMFVCHGNICRSPMAEFIMKKIVTEKHIENEYYIRSSATSTEEIGKSVYPPAKAELLKHGISCNGKTAVQLKKSDYENYDYFIGMDTANIRNMNRIFGNDKEEKIYKLLNFANNGGDVADPWYTGNFSTTYNDILQGCNALLEYLQNLDRSKK